MVWDFPAPLLTPRLCLGFAPSSAAPAYSRAHIQAPGMWLFTDFNIFPHIRKTVGLLLTPLRITVLLTSFLAWLLTKTGHLQSYHSIQVFW